MHRNQSAPAGRKSSKSRFEGTARKYRVKESETTQDLASGFDQQLLTTLLGTDTAQTLTKPKKPNSQKEENLRTPVALFNEGERVNKNGTTYREETSHKRNSTRNAIKAASSRNLADELQTAITSRIEAQKSVKILQDRNSELEKSVSKLQNEKLHLTTSLSSPRKSRNDGSLRQSQEENLRKDGIIKTLQARILGLQRAVANVRKIESKLAEAEIAINSLAEKDDVIDALRSEVTQYSRHLKSRENKIQQQEFQINQQKKQIRESKPDYKDSKISEMQKRIAELEKANDSLETQNSRLLLANIHTDLRKVDDNVTSPRNEISLSQGGTDSLDETASLDEVKLENRDNKELAKQNSKLNNLVQILQSENHDLRERNDSLNSEQEYSQESFDAFSQEEQITAESGSDSESSEYSDNFDALSTSTAKEVVPKTGVTNPSARERLQKRIEDKGIYIST